jgi:hypothetical protein
MLCAKDYFLILALLSAQFCRSQNIPFTNVNPFVGEIPLIYESNFGSGVSFFDVDEDGWDDLTLCTDTGDTRYYRNIQGQLVFTYNFKNTKNAKACVWGDVNEDGYNDLIVTRYDAQPQLFLGAMGNTFVQVFIGLENPFLPTDQSIGVALGDLNRDGFLDVGIANYSYYTPNRVYLNEGGVNFNPINHPAINNNTNPSFQPCWIDINNDLFPELFIVNDHLFDNELYEFNNGTPTEYAVQQNLAPPADAMSNSWEDFDRDGDMDLFISNSPFITNLLLQNDGTGFFNDISNTQPLEFFLESWSGLWIDEDNDSWSDLMICSREGHEIIGILNNKYFKNNQGMLEDVECPNLTSLVSGYYASAKGDFNNDGFSDLVITPESNGSVSALENASNHFIYENTSESTNRYFKFRLEGRLSNRNGFGTKYTAYFDSSLVSGYTMSAGNYLGQNSQNIIIGLGQSTTIDSLILVWPSGVVDHYYNLNSNQFQLLTEAETMMGIQTEAGNCPGEPATASLTNWPDVIWSNNQTSSTTIFNTSTISASVGTGFGHRINLSASLPEQPIVPDIVVSANSAVCLGDGNGSANVYLLNAEGDTLEIRNYTGLFPGEYQFPITYNNVCQVEAAFSIGLIDSTQIHFNVGNLVCADSSLVFNPTILNSTTPLVWNSIEPGTELFAGDYAISATTSNGCWIDTSFSIQEVVPPSITSSIIPSFPTSELSLSISGAYDPYECVWSDGTNGTSYFWTDSTAITALITDGLGCLYESTFVLTGIEEEENSIQWHSNSEGIFFSGNCVLQNFCIYNEVGQLLYKTQYLQPFAVVPVSQNSILILRSEKNKWIISK